MDNFSHAAIRQSFNSNSQWSCYFWKGFLYLTLEPIADNNTRFEFEDFLDEFFEGGAPFIKLNQDFSLTESIIEGHNIKFIDDQPLPDSADIIDLSNVSHPKFDSIVNLMSFRFSNNELLHMGLDLEHMIDDQDGLPLSHESRDYWDNNDDFIH